MRASIVPGKSSPGINRTWSFFNNTDASTTATKLNSSTMSSPNPTLAQLLKRVGEAHLDSSQEQTPEHHVIQMRDQTQLHHENQIPFILTFTNLTYSVKLRRKINFQSIFNGSNASNQLDVSNSNSKTKTLLDGISGEACDGQILAVLGASGSGKSTLIDALANRISQSSLKGSIKLNNSPINSRLLKSISAYVMQDDLLYPMLTVTETLMFAAEFRLPQSLCRTKKRARVEALIDQLGIRSAANTVIGHEGYRGVSGGERRRVSIGTDIVHDPIVLFLDEPTSGLDSTSAFMVIKVLQRIAQSGSMVIISIHQPSSRILNLLDRLIFLSRGQTVYTGPPGDLAAYFAEFGYPIPEPENQTEFALDLIREMEESPGGTRSLVEFHKRWENKRIRIQNSTRPDPTHTFSLKEAISASISKGKLMSGAGNGGSGPSSMVPRFANPIWTEMGILSKRSFLNWRRMPELYGIRLGAIVVTGFILATMFSKLDNTPKGAQERLGFIAFAMTTTFYTCADALPVFLYERFIFMRETAHNAYRRSSYVLTHSLVVLPGLLFLSFMFSVITFWAVGLAGGFSGFLFYFLIIFASFWAGSSFVTFLSGVVSQVMIGFTVSVAILAYFLLFSGFFITRERIPGYWIWFHYISLVKYPYEAVMQNEFGHPGNCFVRGVQIFDNTPLMKLSDILKEQLLQDMAETLRYPLNSTTCLTTGVDLLQQQTVTQLSKWGCLWVTVAWGFFFRFLFYISLLLGSKDKRH